MVEEQQKQAQNVRKPVLVKIIAVISILIGIRALPLVFLFFTHLGPTPSDFKYIIFAPATIMIIMSIFLFVGGMGLLFMKKWGLYIFSLGALIMVIDVFSGIGSPYATLNGTIGPPEAPKSLLILNSLLVIYGIASLVYLWRTKKNFA